MHNGKACGLLTDLVQHHGLEVESSVAGWGALGHVQGGMGVSGWDDRRRWRQTGYGGRRAMQGKNLRRHAIAETRGTGGSEVRLQELGCSGVPGGGLAQRVS